MSNLKTPTKFIAPLVSTFILGSILEAGTTLAVTFKDVTSGRLEFRDSQGIQIGNGSFEYTPDSVEGTFITGRSSSSSFQSFFITDPSQLPLEFVLEDSFSIAASDDFRLVTNIEAQISGVDLDTIQFDSILDPGAPFINVLLFQPPETEFFPPGPGELLNISVGDPRIQGLFVGQGWFLTDVLFAPFSQYRIFLNSNGDFDGFLPPEAVTVQGTWTAQAIPEPLTILGTATALGFGTLFKKKKLSSKAQ